MHEVSIAEALVEAVLREVESRGAPKVVSVKTVVGGLTHIQPENLEFWYDEFIEGTPLEGSRLVVEKRPVTVSCRHCEKEFEVRGTSFICPHCNVADVRITSGDELILESIEVEE